MGFSADGGHAVPRELGGDHARDDHAGTAHRPSRRGLRLPRSRAIERWLSLLSSSTSLNQITTWKVQLEGGAADVFGCGNGAAQPAVDVKSLHAKIGECCTPVEADAGERLPRARSARWIAAAQSDDRP